MTWMERERWHRQVRLRRPDGQRFDAWLGIARAGEENATDCWLHPDEAARAKAMRFPVRRDAYLLGRLAAKRALAGAMERTPARAISIVEGVFGQPIVTCADSGRLPSIGIAHSGGWAAALSFDPQHPMGIDIEADDPAKADAMRSQATKAELKLIEPLAMPDRLTLLWTAKEALAKALTTGLMCPMWVYEVDAIMKEAEFDMVSFRHMLQYRALSFIIAPGMRCSLALPRRSQILTEMTALQT